MQRVSELALGQRLEVYAADRWWPTRIEDHLPDGRMTLAWPMDGDRHLIELQPGDALEVLRVAPGGGEGTYTVAGRVTDCQPGGVPLVTLALTGEWRRSQRRGAYRASVAIRPRVAQIVYGEARRTVRLGVINVSASGVQVRSQDEVRRGDLLLLAFELDDAQIGFEREIEVWARVRHVARLERVWDAGCVFEGISQRLAERIVQFIFAQQRVMLRARRGDR